MKLLIIAYAAVLFFGETICLFYLNHANFTLRQFFAWHLSQVCVTFSLGLLLHGKTGSAIYFLQLSLWNMLAGPFGTMIATSLVLIPDHQTKNDFATWLTQQSNVDARSTLRRLNSDLQNDRLRMEGASNVPALADIFRSGTRQQKFDALTAIGRRFHPSLAPLLEIAANDRDASVRVLAFSVKSKTQKQFDPVSKSGKEMTVAIRRLGRLPEHRRNMSQSGDVDDIDVSGRPSGTMLTELRRTLTAIRKNADAPERKDQLSG